MNNVIIIKILAPSSIFLGSSEWKIEEDFEIDGIAVDGNDAPWGAFADLLVDMADRSWVGVSFMVDDPAYVHPMQQAIEKLDKSSIRYNACLHGAKIDEGGINRIDITWADARDQSCVLAQLTCGQWFWWYATEGDWGVCKPIVAFGIRDIEDILTDFKLKFPASLKFDTDLAVRSYPPWAKR